MKQLKCVSGGDSWCFELPFDLGTGGGIAKALFGTCLGVPFTNIAHPGDSSEESMGLGMSSKLRSVLPGADILLWSSGGDDFAGDGFRIYLHRNIGQPAVEAVNLDFLDAALTVTMNDYRRLVQIRDEVAPNCLIVCGCYDFPPASQMGHGFITYGPWLKPGLVDAGWTNPDDQEAIVKQFLLRLKKHISEFAAMSRKFLFVDCQGVCGAEDWANELHLNRGGCLKHGQVINAQLLPWLDIISTLSQPGGASDKAGQPADAPASVTPPAPDYG
jgi:hypothetical protein